MDDEDIVFRHVISEAQKKKKKNMAKREEKDGNNKGGQWPLPHSLRHHVRRHEGERRVVEKYDGWHAFKQPSPRENFVGMSRNVVEYSGGLPPALEVLGSYLFERGVAEWKCVLEKLKKIPNDQVHEKLKISYDGLNDDIAKEIFLDIACFFIGMDRNDVIHIF
ncbi:NB-ARC domain disease resistance protein [Medicago truncatula]|uniref:NB-ARC domain disease resistance protein n=1 Tax=Medicago truncatula TaxID=3880 RepID=G7JXJ1_MEDTR|nr:NB-ARC domain disease resistance protein [Medicago truncatula]